MAVVTIIDKEITPSEYFDSIVEKFKSIDKPEEITTMWGWDEFSEDDKIKRDFEELENFLFEICPHISYLYYKKIFRDLVFYDCRSEFANSYKHPFGWGFYIKIQDLKDFLLKYNLIEIPQ